MADAVKRLALLLFLALPAFADPDLAGIAKRLSDEDPVVREAAREEALRLESSCADELERLGAASESLEARMACREIVTELRDREIREPASRLSLSSETALGELIGMQDLAVPILLWKARHVQDGEGFVFPPDLDRALDLLEVVTLHSRRDLPGWEVFVASHRGVPLAAMQEEGLEARGFRVRSGTAGERAAELMRAFREASRSSRLNLRPTILDLAAERCGRALSRRSDLDAKGERPLDAWYAANKDRLALDGAAIVSIATPAELRSQLESDDALIRRGALWTFLTRFPKELPDSAWRLVSAHPGLVFACIAASGRKVPADALQDALAVAGRFAGRAEFASLWDAEAIDAWFQGSDPADSARRSTGAALLDQLGRSDILLRLSRTDLRILESRGIDPADVALDVLDHEPGRAGSIAEWAASAPPSHGRRLVAFKLARLGNAKGLSLALQYAADRVIVPVECAWLRDSVEGAPGNYDRDAWAEWGRRGTDDFAWDAGRKKWIKP